MEPWHIIVICILFVVGITVLITCFFIVRRLHELHAQHNKIDGELFISDSGEMYSEFVVPVDELISKNYILMKVNHVTIKGGEKK